MIFICSICKYSKGQWLVCIGQSSASPFDPSILENHWPCSVRGVVHVWAVVHVCLRINKYTSRDWVRQQSTDHTVILL